MWKFYMPVDVYFGERRIADLNYILEEKGLDKALLMCDKTSVSLGLADKVKFYSQGKIVAVFDGVESNPTVDNIDDCLKVVKGKDIRAVIALGGGSTMDCAKGVAACLKLGISGTELLDCPAISEGIPLVCIPTTAGTASEVTQGAVISDHKRGIKKAIFGPGLFARVAIDDPELTYTCPPSVTAACGIDVMAHALDSLTSVKTNQSTIGSAIYAAKTVFAYLERAYREGGDLVARRKMMEACVEAGLAFSQTGTTGSHACSYYLTSAYGMPHGEACAFTLDWWFRENAKARPALDEYAKMMGFADAAAVADEISRMKETFRFRTTVRELVSDAAAVDAAVERLADEAMAAGNMANNVWKASREDVLRLFNSKR